MGKKIFILLLLILILVHNYCCWGFNKNQNNENKDLYKVLELTKKASKEEIKKQYRKLTKIYHPDKNPESKSLFTEISEAYEILSDPKRRRIYDTKGYQAAKNIDANNQTNDDMDILSRFFGGQIKRDNKMDDFKIKLKVSLKDLYIGKELEFKYTRNIICPNCRGSGADSEEDIQICPKCKGQGVILETRQLAPGYIQQFQKQCSSCNGQGKVIKKECHVCHSQKIIQSIENLSVYVEKGMKNGQEIVITINLYITGF